MLDLFGIRKKAAAFCEKETPRRLAPQSTLTLRALSDLGESIASSVHVMTSPLRMYLCVTMEPKPEALRAQMEADARQAAGMFHVDALWSAAEVNARWARHAVLTDGRGNVLEAAVSGARGMTDVGAKEAFFEFNTLEYEPEELFLSNGTTRIRIR